MSIEVGEKLTGKVSGITNFGAFIDLGNKKTGLVHISEISNSFVKDIHDVLTVGDEVTVLVTSVGEDGKIGLSIRKLEDKPKEEKKEQENAAKRPTEKKNQAPGQNSGNKQEDFDALMNSFLKESDDRLFSLRKNTEGKRGGRGGRRN
ncbi:S1 domain-containing RNA-binding protein [Tetragenococcus muriaticus]|uniref:Ribosomal protein S1 domain-containing RNA-binding protein n=1 Tax=Tetragenococcus muriaticus 3MR10-3 TaxID=1302648 RepID=A0A091CBV6_9ENTE|nr:S1 domain-containing RNA-binding protein [Tetragenococcus muriaticus]KFN89248.1 ribosomal protein S1 domain-containing RNA-binding protein [Tetragenococcus muriaticus 3MR10-3]